MAVHRCSQNGRARAARRTAALSASLLFTSCALHGQGTTASLSGTVTDPSGAVIPNAIVTLKNQDSGDTRPGKSNGSGDFTFSAVPVGTYEIDITSQGFAQFRQGGIHLDPGDSRNLHELKLVTGSEAQTVNVREASQSITLDSGEQSSLISAEDIKHLSVEGRDVTELLKILPGFAITAGGNATNTAYDPSQVQVTGAIGNYSGEGTEINTIALLSDGVDITDPGNYGAGLQNINYDQVAEVKTQTASFTADEARGPIVINAVGKSGGDHFHGSLYTYARTNQLDSSDWLSNYTGQAKPPDRQVYPGFTFGGPVYVPGLGFNKSKRLTFFVGAEDYAQRNVYAYGNASSAILSALVPTAGMRGGDFSQAQLQQYLGPNLTSGTYANINSVPVTGKNGAPLTNGNLGGNIDPVNQALLNTLPLPNEAPTASGFNYVTTNLIDDDLWQAKGRVDYAISDRNKLFVVYSKEAGKAGVPQAEYYSPRGNLGGVNIPGGGLLSDINSEIGSLNFTTIISPTITNEFFGSGAWLDQNFTPRNFAATTAGGVYTNTGLFNNGSKVIPAFQDYGNDGLPLSLLPDASFGGVFAKKWVRTAGDNLTKVLGPHTIRIGIFAQIDTNHQVTPFVQTNGTIDLYYFGETYTDPVQGLIHDTGAVGSGNGGNFLADFLEGGVFQYSQANIQPAPNLYFWNIDGYAQDHYRITPHLTVDYGVRFDHFTPWSDSHGIGIPVWNPATYTSGRNPLAPGFLWHAIDPHTPSSGLATRWAFVEPRVGFAWDAYGTGQTVVRGGFGIYRAHDSSNDVNPGANTSLGLRSVSLNGPLLLSSVSSQAATITAGNGFVRDSSISGFFANDDQQPQVYTYNFAIDQKAFFNSLVEVAYIGNLSRHLLNDNAGNVQTANLDDINALHVGALFGPDPVTGTTYPIVAPSGQTQSTQVSSLTTQQIDDFRPYNHYNHLHVAQHNLYGNYNSLQVQWNKQQGRAIYGVNYTFSKALGVLGANANGLSVDPFNYRNDYNPESFDRTHIFNASYSYSFGSLTKNRYAGWAANGWELSGITNLQSGGTFYAQNNPNFGLSGTLETLNAAGQPGSVPVSSIGLLGTTDVELMPRITCDPSLHTRPHEYVRSDCFALPSAPGVNGDYRIPYTKGPAYSETDLTAAKDFRAGEGRDVQFRFEAFNFINHANTTFTTSVQPQNLILNYNNGNTAATAQPLGTVLATAPNTNAGVFGQTSLRTGRRVVELALKFNF